MPAADAPCAPKGRKCKTVNETGSVQWGLNNNYYLFGFFYASYRRMAAPFRRAVLGQSLSVWEGAFVRGSSGQPAGGRGTIGPKGTEGT